MIFNKLINEVLEVCIHEIKKDKNRVKIEEEVLSPLIEYILEKIKPYVIGTSVFLITIILLILCILYLLLVPRVKSN